MYQAALERLAREYAAIQDIDKDTAAVKLEEIWTPRNSSIPQYEIDLSIELAELICQFF